MIALQCTTVPQCPLQVVFAGRVAGGNESLKSMPKKRKSCHQEQASATYFL